MAFDSGSVMIILAVVFGFLMAVGVGANDVANAMGTTVGSKVLTLKQAIFVAVIFEAAGAFFASGEVTATIRSGIISPTAVLGQSHIFILGMLASLLAAAIWLGCATYLRWPVSTTHSIIGAIMGFGLVVIGSQAINWIVVMHIVLSWVVTPLISGVVAYALFRSVCFLVLNGDEPLLNAKRFLPLYMFVVAFIVASITLIKGLKHLHLLFSTNEGLLISCVVGLIAVAIGMQLMRRIALEGESSRAVITAKIEQVFGVLTVFTACALAFAHGSNDVANAIGPLAAVVTAVRHGLVGQMEVVLPVWIPALGALGIIVGLSAYGHRVIETIGNDITLLTPSRAFASQLATAGTVVVSSGLGMPVSTTQVLVGAVLGVGFARGISALNLRVIGNIFVSWVITVPAGALLSVLFYHVLKLLWRVGGG